VARPAGVPNSATTRSCETCPCGRRGAGVTAQAKVGLDRRLPGVKDVRRTVPRSPEKQTVRDGNRAVCQGGRILVNNGDIGGHLFGNAGKSQAQCPTTRRYHTGDVIAGVAIILRPPRPSSRIRVVGQIRVHPMGRHDRITCVHTRKDGPSSGYAGLALHAHHVQISCHNGGAAWNGRHIQRTGGWIGGAAVRKTRGRGHIPITLTGVGNILADVLFVVTRIRGSSAISGATDAALTRRNGGGRRSGTGTNPKSDEQGGDVGWFPADLGSISRYDLVLNAAVNHHLAWSVGNSSVRPIRDASTRAPGCRCGRHRWRGGRRTRCGSIGGSIGGSQCTLRIRAPGNGEDTVRRVTRIKRRSRRRIQVNGMGSV